MKQKTYFFLWCCFFCCTSLIHTEIFFSGFTGAKGDFYSDPQTKDEKGFDPLLEVQAYFSGQLNISKKFMVRGEFSVQSEDIFGSGIFNDTEALFCINELSATYVKPFLGNTQYISAFFGTFEPIGSDVFLQRQFGMRPITSLTTESWLGLRGSYIYPFYGAGVAYILHFDKWPVASGFYLYKNHAQNEDDDDQINIDWRFAAAMPYLALDFAAGIGAPLSKHHDDDDVILLIDTLYLHSGVGMLLGNRYAHSLFVQAGFEQVALRSRKEESKLKDNDIYLLFEPRFTLKACKIHLTFFNFPASLFKATDGWSSKKLIFIEDSLGINVTVFTDSLYIKNWDVSFGIATTLSFPDHYLFDLKKPNELFENDEVDSSKNFNVKLSPFLTLPILSGELHMMLQANITDFRTEGWENAIKLNIGYKSQL